MGKASGEGLVELQAAALTSVSDAVMITERDGVIVWVNAAFSTMSGYSAEEVVGATPRLLKSGEQDGSYYRRLWETILAGRQWRAEVVERQRTWDASAGDEFIVEIQPTRNQQPVPPDRTLSGDAVDRGQRPTP